MQSSKHWNIWLAVALLAQWGLGVACDAGPEARPGNGMTFGRLTLRPH